MLQVSGIIFLPLTDLEGEGAARVPRVCWRALLCNIWLNPWKSVSTSTFDSADWDEERQLENAQVGKRKQRLCRVIVFR